MGYRKDKVVESDEYGGGVEGIFYDGDHGCEVAIGDAIDKWSK